MGNDRERVREDLASHAANRIAHLRTRKVSANSLRLSGAARDQRENEYYGASRQEVLFWHAA